MTKEIYSFTVDKKKKVEVMEELSDGSRLTKTEEQIHPVKIVIKVPSRTEVQDSEVEYAREYGKLFRAGILTKEMVKKAYESSGFIEEKRKRGLEIIKLINEIQTRYDYLSVGSDESEEVKVERAELEEKWRSVNSELQNIETSIDSIFSNTVENLVEKYIITYLTVFLTVWEDGKPIFKGDNYDAKIKSHDALIEHDRELYGQIADRAAYIVALYYTGKASSKEEFDAFFGVGKEEKKEEKAVEPESVE